jgi:hypothetical protein
MLVVLGCVSLASSAHSQSLAELAKKEKARRAANVQSGKSAEVVTVDEVALRNAESSTFTAVESNVRTASPRPELESTAPNAAARDRASASARNEPSRSGASTSNQSANGNQVAETDLGKGWSTNHDNQKGLRPAPPGTQPIHPTSPRTQVGLDKNGNPIYVNR